MEGKLLRPVGGVYSVPSQANPSISTKETEEKE